jgi:tRNA threonylcarbamoyladenosine biosynthesis protein TsaB
MQKNEPKLLIIETSGKTGEVGIGLGDRLIDYRRLDQARRHARDLAPAVRDMLDKSHWNAQEIDGVIVSHGPGSYTGLRVGIMSAKTLAYASGCRLLAVKTFEAIAAQAPAGLMRLDVIADAQQNKIYWQRFQRGVDQKWETIQALSIVPLEQWLAAAEPSWTVTGPGLHLHLAQVSACFPVLEETSWDPRAESLLKAGLARYLAGERDEIWNLEPLYLRPSSAEEKMVSRPPP